MTDYTSDIARIKNATTPEEIQTIARRYPANAVAEGGVLYSGKVGEIGTGEIANDMAKRKNLPIIDHTSRGQFLAHGDVNNAIKDSAERIFRAQGQDPTLAAQLPGQRATESHILSVYVIHRQRGANS